MVLALLGALGRLSKNPVAFGVSGFYTSFFRGTPLIVQLFLIYLALPQIGASLGSAALLNVLALTAFQAGIIGLGLNYGAYITEIFRAGIQSVGHGQAEAADALGMSYAQRMRRVVLPQATRVIIPPTGNDFIAMMKDTALVAFLGVVLEQADLFRRAQLIGNQDLKRLESLIIAAAMYWALTAVFTFFQMRLERRMSAGYVRGEAQTAMGRKRTQFLPAGPPGAVQPGVGEPGIELDLPGGDPPDLDAARDAAMTIPNGEAVVKVENLYKRFGQLEVLRGINMEVDKGEVVVIFGRSGSGKSTLLRCVNFLEDPTEGTVEVSGIRLEGGPPDPREARADPAPPSARGDGVPAVQSLPAPDRDQQRHGRAR